MAPGTSAGGDVVAKAATYYRVTRYIMVLILLGMGGWFGYDGFVGWPSENVRIHEIRAKIAEADKWNRIDEASELKKDPLALKQPHTATDILIQKLLCFGLPMAALLMLAWALYNSRGVYMLKGDVLTVPGHPPVKLREMVEIDKKLWDRKGIAYVRYSTDTANGTLRLDDFVYEREGTDQIYDRLIAHMAGSEA